ncbi:hypothetical protein XENTR_v10008313 [Xenopus tropicalis]|uniref:Uncharacterized protein LOC108646272 n=1 Tax=Xenopus tropicalis TaxID=8364 RepID=A0A8J0T2Z1_XENTR|nr:uncharacterized protein LOC108646272 [Xenopus tropicalis]KAE8614793.1 hypothetical protein XENTR_v10008313 [Xenopus tropicalis]
MKIAVAFLLVALSSCFDSSTATLDPELAKCLNALVQKDLPGTVDKLIDILCLYQQGKDENNSELFRQFLTQLDTLLATGGCSLDKILGTQDVLQTSADKIGDVARSVGQKLLDTLATIPVLGTVFNGICPTGKSLQGLLGDVTKVIGGLGFKR